jgi:hypothetical protein
MLYDSEGYKSLLAFENRELERRKEGRGMN